jgi:mono/diheme cytochrome c family protein
MKTQDPSCSRSQPCWSRLLACLAFVALASQIACQKAVRNETDLSRDGYQGPVRGVLIESVAFGDRADGWGEIQQSTSTIRYDEMGRRTLSTPFKFPLPGGFAEIQYDAQYNPAEKGRTVESPFSAAGGKWVQRFDEKGNLIEKSLIDPSGSLVSKLTNAYVFDAQGNWVDRETKKDLSKQDAMSGRTVEVIRRYIFYGDQNPPERSAHSKKTAPNDSKLLTSPIRASQDDLARGQSLFYQRCASCHGEDGKSQTEIAAVGNLKPADLTLAAARSLSDGEIFWKISEAGEQSGTPALKDRLPDEDRWRIVHYLRLVQKGEKLQPLTLAAVEEHPAPAAAASRIEPQKEQRYSLRGKVISVDKATQQVTIEHEEIKGYMGAMTMPFPLAEKTQLDSLKPGDRIEGTLVVGQGWRLENVKSIKP